MSDIKEHDWFKQDYTPAHPEEDDDDVHIDDEALSINEVLCTKIKALVLCLVVWIRSDVGMKLN